MVTKMVAAGGIAVAGLVGLAPTAGAAESGTTEGRTSGSVSAQYAPEMTVTNTTDQILTVDSHWVVGTTWAAEPLDGTRLYPGQSLRFAVNAKGDQGRDAGWVYLRVGRTKSFVAAVAKPSFSVGMRDSRVDHEPLTDSAVDTGPDAYRLATSGWSNTTLTVSNTRTATHRLTSEQAGEQVEALREICANDSTATCTFRPTSYSQTFGAPKRAGTVLRNSGMRDVTQAYTWTSTTTTTSQWGVEAGFSATLFGTVTNSFKATFGQTYSSAETATSTTTVPVPPGYSAWVEYSAPVYRTVGDFTAKVGGNTWYITDVVFDIPKPDPNREGLLDVQQRPNGDPDIPTGATVTSVG